jgi:dTDP-4-amino-4,6-dideoxygalactose transaminase
MRTTEGEEPLDDILVTRPFLPPLEELLPDLQEIWDSRWLTNRGSFHELFRSRLASELGVDHLELVASGTLGLLTSLSALGVRGDVITTPFTFVATAHAIRWLGLNPVFADIDPVTMNIDPESVEALITSNTAAILPVHCFGYPCDVDAISKIAVRDDVPVVYDAAHAFGVEIDGTSLGSEGDMSVLSFHATKVFNTFEGGAVVCQNAEMARRIADSANFGIQDELSVTSVGINAKMNEFAAVVGLHQLDYVDYVRERRRSIDDQYRRQLAELDWLQLPPVPGPGTTHNYAYFPIRIETTKRLARDDVFQILRERGIVARRYFYPLITDMQMYDDAPRHGSLSNASRVASEIICLPIFPEMTADQQDRVIDALVSVNA